MGRRREAPGATGGPRVARVVAGLPQAVPVPYEAFSDSPNLVDTERADLAACEAAIDGLRVAFWAAGKALQVIRDAKLYRATHGTFEEYCEDRWEMSRPQAYRLINAWPLAEALSPIGDKTLNESHVRVLLPLSDQHGRDAAVTVYRAVADVAQEDGGRVTAGVLQDVMKEIGERFDPATAVEQIRKYLADGSPPPEDGPPDPALEWRQVDRLRATVRRTVPAFRRALQARPEETRAIVAELRELLDEIEREAK